MITATETPIAPEAADLLSALGRVFTSLRRSPLPISDEMHDRVHGLKPKPRHISAIVLVAIEGPLSVTALAERQKVSLATASQIVSDLVDLGLVQRLEDPTDRRRTLVEMTAAHRELADRILDSRLRPLSRALEQMSEAERDGLLNGLLKIAAAVEDEHS